MSSPNTSGVRADDRLLQVVVLRGGAADERARRQFCAQPVDGRAGGLGRGVGGRDRQGHGSSPSARAGRQRGGDARDPSRSTVERRGRLAARGEDGQRAGRARTEGVDDLVVAGAGALVAGMIEMLGIPVRSAVTGQASSAQHDEHQRHRPATADGAARRPSGAAPAPASTVERSESAARRRPVGGRAQPDPARRRCGVPSLPSTAGSSVSVAARTATTDSMMPSAMLRKAGLGTSSTVDSETSTVTPLKATALPAVPIVSAMAATEPGGAVRLVGASRAARRGTGRR